MATTASSISDKVKRHASLQDLSRDHFQVLVRCQAIRKAGTRRVPAPNWNRMAKDFVAFFESDLNPHFVEEEDFLLPLAGKTPRLSRMVGTVRMAHDSIRAMMTDLTNALARNGDVGKILRGLEPQLDAHVRYEENELFEGLQQYVAEPILVNMWRSAHAFRETHRTPSACGLPPDPPA